MLSQEHSLEVLLRAQTELIREFREIFGQRYTYPNQVVHQIINRIHRSYMQYELRVYSDPGNQPAHQGDGVGFTYVLRMDPSQPNCHHYLYLHVGVEYDNVGSWVINTVSVQCRKIPDDFAEDDQLKEDIADAQHLVRQIHRCMGAEEGDFLEYEPGRKIDHCLTVLRATIVNIWTILKWREPSLERSWFIRYGLASVLHFERYRMIRFREEDGNLMIDFYYKKELLITQSIRLPIAFDELL